MKLTLRHKLLAAFAGVAALVLVVGAFGAFGARTMGQIFDDYRQTARASLIYNDMKLRLESARRSAFIWRTNQSEEHAQRFDEQIEIFIHDADLQGMNEEHAHADEYRSYFREAISHQQIRDGHYATQSAMGPQLRMKLSEVMRSAYTDGDVEAAYRAGLAQEHLMLGRYYAERFLRTNTEADSQRAVSEFELARSELDALLLELENPARRALAQSAIDELAQFETAFSAAATAIFDRNLALAELDRIGPVMEAIAEEARIESVNHQNELGPRAEAEVRQTELMVIAASGLILILSIVMGVLVSDGLSGMIRKITESMTKLAGGDKTIKVAGTERADEIGDMARALAVFRDQALEVDRLQAEQKEAEARAARERKAAMMDLADQFENQVGSVIQSLSDAAQEMQTRSQILNTNVDNTNVRASSVAAAAEQASGNVEAVASAAEELTASIREIAGQVANSASAVQASNARAEISSQQLDRLNTAVAGVDEIVQAINAVADQTNLLALNATIEAARAGEAGKGFAVVASEVKALATQTQKLTEQIADRLNEIGSTSNDAISATRDILGQVQEIDRTTQALSAAVEEQSAATGEISANAQQAAEGARTVTSDITDIQGSVQKTSTVSDEVSTAASALKSNSEHLRTEVQRFLSTVRAA
ncbi:methyl-accepting chemotaxis protein [Oceanicaulis sp. LC35]|uniref:methyl-accepting chemotaxis protein n=1 Tax=Oceanicaulis sp. LC35 TaxID=3349635 RepID=UPI003F844D05